MNRQYISIIKNTVAILLLATFVGFVLLCLVYLIPAGSIENTRSDMYSIMESETPNLVDERFFTYGYGCKNMADVFIYRLSGEDQNNPLFYNVVGADHEGDNRYWDGFMVLVIPMMTFLSYGQIRFLFTVISVTLIWYIIYKSRDRLPWYFSFSLIIGLVLINMIVNFFSIMLNMVFLISFAFMSYFLKEYNSKMDEVDLYYCFLINGILTTYLDRYTACLLTLEMPLLIIILINIKENGIISLKKNMRALFYSVLGWGIGFSIFWFNKWIIAGIVLRKNIFSSTISQVSMRISTNADSSQVYIEGERGDRLYTIAKNIVSLLPTHGENILPLIVGLAIITVFMFGYLVYRKGHLKDPLKYLPLYILIILPYSYYFIFSNLCQIHATFFMYRMQLVSVIGILYLYFEAINVEKVQ